MQDGEMYKVSILVPVYNAERYIEKCVRSLFGQTYSNLEFVFVDDCSPDKSIDILSRVMDDYPERKAEIKICHNRSNKGAAASKNIAMDNAEGEFICFVDSDDWMELDAIRLLVNQQLKTGADVVWGRMSIHTKEGVTELYEPSFADKQDLLKKYIGENEGGTLLSNSRRIIRKSVVDLYKLRMAEGLNYSEDRLLMTMIVYYSDGFSMIDDVVYHYNKCNELSLTKTSGAKNTVWSIETYKQVAGNFRLMMDFFSDKESVYYEESMKVWLLYLKNMMDSTLRSSSKDGFNVVVKDINDTDARFFSLIGWDRGRLWRQLHSNYYYRKILPIFRARLWGQH